MSSLRERYGLRRVVNAWGTATRYGVSRSPAAVVAAVAEALEGYFDMAEVAALACREIASFAGTESGCITHCTAASITLAVAACMTGKDPAHIARLPDTSGMRGRVVLQAGHRVNYGAPIEQAVRLSGASVVIAGTSAGCSPAELDAALGGSDVAALLLVESHLTARTGSLPLQRAVALAQRRGVPVILDAAAQDRRIHELVASGADLVLFSSQKYLRGPTAGIVVGRRDLVAALELQIGGIGRAMKPSKEAIFGTLAALACREGEDYKGWAALQQERLGRFLERLAQVPGIEAIAVPDPNGNPFARIRVSPRADVCSLDARELAQRLAVGNPTIATGAHYAADGFLNLEILDLDEEELRQLYDGIFALVDGNLK